MSQAASAAAALGWSASDSTTETSAVDFRKVSLRVLKEYARAPNGSGRSATEGDCRQGRSASKAGPSVKGSVHPAHAVDRDLLDQRLLDEFLLRGDVLLLGGGDL